jgi:hypothetical protein
MELSVDGWPEFCVVRCDKKTRAWEAEESPLLKAIAREPLLTQQAGKWLSWCCGDLWIVEINSGAVITCSSEWSVQVVSKSD